MKKKLPDELEPSCSLCEYALNIEVRGETVCKKDGAFTKVDPTYCCRKFSFDILSYRPLPAKLPKFDTSDGKDLI